MIRTFVINITLLLFNNFLKKINYNYLNQVVVAIINLKIEMAELWYNREK